MCPVTMPLTYIQSDCQLCILFVVLVSLLSFSLPVWTCVYAFVCACMRVYMSGKCTAHKLQFTQISLSFMGCLHAFLYSCLLAIPIHSLYSVFIYMEMLLHRWHFALQYKSTDFPCAGRSSSWVKCEWTTSLNGLDLHHSFTLYPTHKIHVTTRSLWNAQNHTLFTRKLNKLYTWLYSSIRIW